MRGRRARPILWSALAVLLAGTAWEGLRLAELRGLNAAIRSGDPEAIPADAPPRALFAKAYHQAQQDQIGAAAELYRQIADRVPEGLRAAVHYNLGNTFYRQAVLLTQMPRANIRPVLQMTRQQYRNALRLDSELLRAKFNLEYIGSADPNPDQSLEFQESTSRPQPGPMTQWRLINRYPEGLP